MVAGTSEGQPGGPDWEALVTASVCRARHSRYDRPQLPGGRSDEYFGVFGSGFFKKTR